MIASRRRIAALCSCMVASLWIPVAWAGPTVSFANDVQPIFDARCIFCHSGATPPAGLDLSAGLAHDNLVNQPTSPGCMITAPDSVRVVPFDPPSSMLWLKTLPDDSRCGAPMPRGTKGLAVIAPDDFALIETWITEGALDN